MTAPSGEISPEDLASARMRAELHAKFLPMHAYLRPPPWALPAPVLYAKARLTCDDLLAPDLPLNTPSQYVDLSLRQNAQTAWDLAYTYHGFIPTLGKERMLQPEHSWFDLRDLPEDPSRVCLARKALRTLLPLAGPGFLDQVWQHPNHATDAMLVLPEHVCWIYPHFSCQEQSFWLFRSLLLEVSNRLSGNNTMTAQSFYEWFQEAKRCGFRVALLRDPTSDAELNKFGRELWSVPRVELAKTLYFAALRLAREHTGYIGDSDPGLLRLYGPHAVLQLGCRIFVPCAEFFRGMPGNLSQLAKWYGWVTFTVADLLGAVYALSKYSDPTDAFLSATWDLNVHPEMGRAWFTGGPFIHEARGE